MADNNIEKSSQQNVFLYNRERLEMTGVTDVYSFSESSVEMTLTDGYVAIDGENLRIDSFNSSTGKITVIGKISDISYFGSTVREKIRKKKKS